MACQINSSFLSFSKDTFVGELSDLGDPILETVYDEETGKCDYGFSIISAKTGNPATFMMCGVDKDHGGEVAGYRFTCVTPGLKHLRALLIND